MICWHSLAQTSKCLHEPKGGEKFKMGANELAHHGILGMKWGVRRYQNKDGTLTAAGKKRYADGGEAKNTSSKTEERKPVKKASSMTDDELRQAVNRLQMEKQYNELTKVPKQTSKGKAFVAEVLEKSGKAVATQTATWAMGMVINKMVGQRVVNVGDKDKKKDE